MWDWRIPGRKLEEGERLPVRVKTRINRKTQIVLAGACGGGGVERTWRCAQSQGQVLLCHFPEFTSCCYGWGNGTNCAHFIQVTETTFWNSRAHEAWNMTPRELHSALLLLHVNFQVSSEVYASISICYYFIFRDMKLVLSTDPLWLFSYFHCHHLPSKSYNGTWICRKLCFSSPPPSHPSSRKAQ